MPIVPPKVADPGRFLDFSQKIARAPEKDLGENRRRLWQKLCKEHGLEFIGSGTEKLVFGFGNPAYAYALSHRLRKSPLEIAATWQLNKILNTLFPEVFPKMHAVHTIQERGGTQALFVMQRIHGKPIEGSSVKRVTKQIETKVRKVFDLPRSQQNIVFDQIGDGNLIQDASGKIYYIEVVSPRSSAWQAAWEYVDISMLLSRREALEEYMRKNDLTPQQQRKVLSALEKLAQLTIAEEAVNGQRKKR